MLLKKILEPLLVCLFLAVVTVTALKGIDEVEQQTRNATGEALGTVLHTTQEALQLWGNNRIKDAMVIANRDAVHQLAVELSTQAVSGELTDHPAQTALRNMLEDEIIAAGYLGYFIISPDKISIASMRNSNIGSLNLIALQRPELFQRVLQGESLIIPTLTSDVRLKRDQHTTLGFPPTMFVATPIWSEKESDVIGIFTLRLDPVRHFSKITQLGRIGDTGETYAFDEMAVMLTESRFNDQLQKLNLIKPGEFSTLNIHLVEPDKQGNGSHSLSLAQKHLTLMAGNALNGHSGINTDGYRDYRGIEVFGTWLWDEQMGLGLATEIDAEEALQPYYFARKVILTTLSITAILSILLAMYLSRVRSRSVQDLLAAQAVLESRVNERTADLFRVNNRLQAQVVQRTKAQEQLMQAQAELEEKNQQLLALASLDGLTGIPNRRAFDDHMLNSWHTCSDKRQPLSLILLDVDSFKEYNDTYGHSAGDKTLKAVSQVLAESIYAKRPGDLIARYGGEEFAVILSNTRLEDAARIAEKICLQVDQLMIEHSTTKADERHTVTISAGVACLIPYHDKEHNIARLIEHADEALYQAKRQGRNQAVSYQSPTAVA